MSDIPDPKSLDEALAVFQSDPPVLVKDKKGQVGNQKTRYADLVQVNAAVLSRLNRLGVIYVCEPTLLDSGQFVLRYRLTHVPTGEYKTGQYPLKLSENPQHMGSAITYARRYVLLALTGVAADDEDDDGTAANGHRYAQRTAPTRRQASRDAEPAQPDRPTAQRAQRPASRPPLPGETDTMTRAQQGKMHALFGQVDITDRDDRMQYVNEILAEKISPDRQVGSSSELTKAEAGHVIDALQRWAGQLTPEGSGT